MTVAESIAARANGLKPAGAARTGFVKPPPVAERQLKTLQWDKVTAVALGSTVWDREKGSDLESKLRAQGIFDQMEEDFRAKQTVKMASRKQAQTLESVLSVKERQRIGQSLSLLLFEAELIPQLQRSPYFALLPTRWWPMTPTPVSWPRRSAFSATTTT